MLTVKPVSNGHKLIFKTNYHLMQDKSIAECSKGSILQYFQPSLSYQLPLISLFCQFLSGGFTQVLLYLGLLSLLTSLSIFPVDLRVPNFWLNSCVFSRTFFLCSLFCRLAAFSVPSSFFASGKRKRRSVEVVSFI